MINLNNNTHNWISLLEIYENCTTASRMPIPNRIVRKLNSLPGNFRDEIFMQACLYKGIPEALNENLRWCENNIGKWMPYLALAIQNVANNRYDLLNNDQKDSIKDKWNASLSKSSFVNLTLIEGYTILLIKSFIQLQIKSADPSEPILDEWMAVLDEWVLDANAQPGENRAEAKERIIKFLSNQILSKLDLSALQLVCLPNIFNASPFCRRLKYLILGDNQLTALPKTIANVAPSLKILHLIYNRLSVFPAEIACLQELEKLSLEGNELTELPSDIGNLIKLKSLGLQFNYLTELPDEIIKLTSLTLLHLKNNLLTIFPDVIANMKNLKLLNLGSNQLTVLPTEIAKLVKLEELVLEDNLNLIGLPIEIFDLLNICVIQLDGCGLSQQVLGRIHGITSAQDYAGPQISYSILEDRPIEEKSIEELLQELYGVLEMQPLQLTTLLNDEGLVTNLQPWLSRLSWTCDYQSGEESRVALAKKIIGYLELADVDSQFCDAFKATIPGASATCGDRVTLSILHVGIQYRLATIDRSNMPEFGNFLLKGLCAIEMLEAIARDKVPTLPCFDEIEIYLGYPVMLKERLGLPIDIEGMLYFKFSALTDVDLEEAGSRIEQMLENEDACHDFLIKNDDWIKALEAKYPEQFVTIRQQRDDMLEDNNSWEMIQQIYNKQLVELSKSAYPFSSDESEMEMIVESKK